MRPTSSPTGILGEPVVANGLGLCRIHHSAYDADIIGVDPDARLHVRESVREEADWPMLRFGLQEIHGSRLVLRAARCSGPTATSLPSASSGSARPD